MLKDSPGIIEKYEEYHAHIWPEVKKGLIEWGVRRALIYRFGRRLFMLLEGTDDFDYERPEKYLKKPRTKEWEDLMAGFQEPVAGAPTEGKWVQMKEVFFLEA
jgi:L-rhamnose mutarotase